MIPQDDEAIRAQMPNFVMGGPASTPLEAVGRLMYHSGMHAGQISMIRKQASLRRA
ncbi:hypothetical protein [Paenibacillus sp. UNC496MF]|uniref:hypothetical protein n=1 Tax=Paenibacillus sp. UNC496MF TaxID=1502753 RepID=UPI0015A4FC58|nr:hypothetical protein [Paenibacillus sp. UNC496MF]